MTGSTMSSKQVQPLTWTQCVSSFIIQLLHWIFATKVIFRSLWRNSWCKSTARLDGKTVIVTGCNTGIGKETCRDLLKRGARIIMACRNLDKAKNAAADIHQSEKDIIKIKHLDLTSLTSVRKFASEILAEEPRIHILINNAGVMANPQDKTEDGFEIHMGVNHLGHFLLTLLLLDRLKKSAPSRIINVSSVVHITHRINLNDINLPSKHPLIGYAKSKLANILFTRALAKRLEGSGVTVYALHPGVILTEIGRNLPEDMNILDRMHFWVYKSIAVTPSQGAQTTIYCAVDESIKNDNGKYYSDCREDRVASHAANDTDAEQLWEISKKLVKLDA